jgi:hypothetical protein
MLIGNNEASGVYQFLLKIFGRFYVGIAQTEIKNFIRAIFLFHEGAFFKHFSDH